MRSQYYPSDLIDELDIVKSSGLLRLTDVHTHSEFYHMVIDYIGLSLDSMPFQVENETK